MKPIAIPASAHPSPGARVAIIGAGRTDVDALPAVVDEAGLVLSEWEFTADELALIMAGGRIRLFVWTGRAPLQQVALEVGNSGDL